LETIRLEVEKFVNWYRSLGFTPTIVALRKKFEEIRKRELDKTFSRHPDLSEREKNSVEALSSAIINKVLHDPLAFLKRMKEESSAYFYIDALQTLFQLSVEPPVSSPEKLEETPAEPKEGGEG